MLKRYAPDGMKVQTLDQLTRQTRWYAMDVSGYLYASQYNAEHKGKNNHIREFFQIISHAAEHGIRFVFVFDGNTRSVAKQQTTEERSEKIGNQKDRIRTLLQVPDDAVYQGADLKALAFDRLNGLPTEERLELAQLLRNYIVIQPQFYADLKELFTRLGAPFLRAQGEADFLCAALYRAGLVDGVMSEDMDMLSHGVGFLVRGINTYRGLTTYTLETILAGLGLTLEQFRELSVLCGCDYCPKLAGVAGIRGLLLLQKHGNLAAVVAAQKTPPPDNFLVEAERAVRIFSGNQEEIPSGFGIPTGYTVNPSARSWLVEQTGPIANLDGKLRVIAAAGTGLG